MAAVLMLSGSCAMATSGRGGGGEGGEGGGGGTGEQTYTVQAGDNLSKIAASFYGKHDWKRIYDANRDQLDDPDKISPGQVLKIPAAD